jgi:mercuric ion transport protein
MPVIRRPQKAEEMDDRNLIRFGVVGTAIAALCCFTPVLVVLVSVVGLSAIVGYLDYVLLPALMFFICLTVYAIWRRQGRATGHPTKQD